MNNLLDNLLPESLDLAKLQLQLFAESQGNHLVGFAHNALREAFCCEGADKLLLIDYELLTTDPAQTLRLIYQFLGEPYFNPTFRT